MCTLSRKALPLLMIFCLAGPAWSMGGGGSGDGAPALDPALRAAWAPVIEEGRQQGVDQIAWEHTATHLAGAGFTPADGSEVLGPALQAAQEGLPAEAVLSKVDEGVLKGVPTADLLQAAEKRLGALRQARGLLQESGFPDGEEQGRGLLVATALALESGVPEPTLTSALDRGKGTPPGQMKAVVEAGEALYLEGLAPEAVQALMADCLDRQLRRPEMLRVVRFARDQHGRGLDGTSIRATLWGGAGGVGGTPGGAAGPKGTAGGQGPAYGAGEGGPGMGGQGNMGGNRPPRGAPR